MRHSIALLVLLTLATAACSTPKSQAAQSVDSAKSTGAATPADPTARLAALRRTIDSGNAAYIDAVKREDLAGATSGNARDAIIMPPNLPAARGLDAIQAQFKRWFAEGTVKEMKLSTEDVMLSGDIAVETGTYDMTVQPATGKETHDRGKYLVVYRQQPDGSWKGVREIDNSDLPARR
jgi:ketosteroid isomerase-like protein